MPRSGHSLFAYKRTALLVFIASALFLWMIMPFSSPRKQQTDRIPFSHDAVEECVLPELLLHVPFAR